MWYIYDIGMDIYNIYLWYIYIYIYIYIRSSDDYRL